MENSLAITFASYIVYALTAWVVVGVLIGIAFVFIGANRIDPSAREGTPGFRLLILPGAIALWPLLLKRWLSDVSEPPSECNAHRRAATAHKTP
ncbi:MAG: hypothetical protein AB8G18_00235 [Gammaproteobacteria bacterium]